jgi:hypothetical protein
MHNAIPLIVAALIAVGTYTKDEPADYWAKRGYSRYDGI